MTEQNKQPPAEAWEGAVAEVAPSKDEIGVISVNWLQSDSVRKLNFGDILYTSQTTATQAAVAAAMLNVRAGLKTAGINMGLAGEELEFFINDTCSNVIPAEANAALEKICLEVIDDLLKVKPHLWTDHNIRAIVTSVIEKGK
jgi:hypothetical protein